MKVLTHHLSVFVEICKFQESINCLKASEKSRQREITFAMENMSSRNGYIGENEWKRWEAEGDAFKRKIACSNYRLPNMEHNCAELKRPFPHSPQ